MYEVMGGRNSMVSWVESEPALAAADYTHFTPKGARRIAELFVRALNQEYDAWKAEASPQKEEPLPNENVKDMQDVKALPNQEGEAGKDGLE
jgi:hypothetical protein